MFCWEGQEDPSRSPNSKIVKVCLKRPHWLTGIKSKVPEGGRLGVTQWLTAITHPRKTDLVSGGVIAKRGASAGIKRGLQTQEEGGSPQRTRDIPSKLRENLVEGGNTLRSEVYAQWEWGVIPTGGSAPQGQQQATCPIVLIR